MQFANCRLHAVQKEPTMPTNSHPLYSIRCLVFVSFACQGTWKPFVMTTHEKIESAWNREIEKKTNTKTQRRLIRFESSAWRFTPYLKNWRNLIYAPFHTKQEEITMKSEKFPKCTNGQKKFWPSPGSVRIGRGIMNCVMPVDISHSIST